MNVVKSGWMGAALASGISGMARKEVREAKHVVGGWLCGRVCL